MDKADIARERVSVLPVRELLTIESVRSIWLAGHEELFLIRARLDDSITGYRTLRTPDALKAALCQCSIGRPAIYVTWQRTPFNKMAWNEHDILDVETQ